MVDVQIQAAIVLFRELGCIIMACPHWLPKQDTLYPETSDFVARNGNNVSCFGNQCGHWTGLNCVYVCVLHDYTMCHKINDPLYNI